MEKGFVKLLDVVWAEIRHLFLSQGLSDSLGR